MTSNEIKMILSKLDQLLQKQIDPTGFMMAGTQLLFKFEDIMYSQVKGLTTKLDAILTKCDENELRIAALRTETSRRPAPDPDFDFGEMHLGS